MVTGQARIPIRINFTLTSATRDEVTREDGKVFLAKTRGGEWELVRYQQDAENGTPIFCGNSGRCTGDWMRLDEFTDFYHLS